MKNRKFFIVGAPKSGTTSLYNYLKQHPSVYLSKLKELHYFAYPEVADTYYRATFIKTFEEYKTHFKLAKSSQIIGDISPSYLYNKHTAQRIYEYDKEAKIIIILRDPVARAISHYLMDVKVGNQNSELIEILENPKKHPLFYKEYVEVGCYYEQVKKYLEVFPKNQVCIMLFDDLNKDKYLFMKKLSDYLNIDSEFDFNLGHKHGAYALPRNTLVGHIKNNKFIGKILNYTPQNIKIFLKRILYTENVEKPQFINEKKILVDLFSQDVARLDTFERHNIPNWLDKYRVN